MTINLGGCQYRYRYPCQDPKNWSKVECNNDACRVEGDCTSNVLGSSFLKKDDEPTATEGSSSVITDDTSKKNNSNVETQISSKIQSTNSVIGLNKGAPRTSDQFEKTSDKLTCTAGVTCTFSEDEKPLTMDTIVSTSEHNLAAG